LCILLGIPPRDLREELGAPRPAIPGVPAQVVVGIPAELLRRRPDIRAAERAVAAQSARIGIATAELYPHFEINGAIALEAQYLDDLFDWRSLTGSVGPRFRWNILNYGRIVNGIRIEEARFQRTAVDYQNTVLNAQREVEDGIVSFLREQSRLEDLRQAVDDTQRALELGLLLYQQGIVGYQRVLDAQRALVLQQDNLAETQGKVALNLVAVYKALGGGWQMRCQDAANEALPPLPAAASIPPDTPVHLPPLDSLVEPIDAPAVESAVKRIPAPGEDPPDDAPAHLPTAEPKPPSSATDDSDAGDPVD
jgi:outer membrane protein TolC